MLFASWDVSGHSTLLHQITRELHRALDLAIIICGGNTLIIARALGQLLWVSPMVYGLAELWGTISLFSPLNSQGKAHF